MFVDWSDAAGSGGLCLFRGVLGVAWVACAAQGFGSVVVPVTDCMVDIGGCHSAARSADLALVLITL